MNTDSGFVYSYCIFLSVLEGTFFFLAYVKETKYEKGIHAPFINAKTLPIYLFY